MVKHIKSLTEIIEQIDKIATISGNSPTAELTHAAFLALRTGATERDKRRYSALCENFKKKPVKAPNGFSYKLMSLQREYLRYVLVERFREAGETWEAAYQRASEYIGDGGKKIAPSTVADSHGKMKNKVLNDPKMMAFCNGLDFEFQIALYVGDPPSGTFMDPDYLRHFPEHP